MFRLSKWYDNKVSVKDAKEQTEEEKNAVVIGEDDSETADAEAKEAEDSKN